MSIPEMIRKIFLLVFFATLFVTVVTWSDMYAAEPVADFEVVERVGLNFKDRMIEKGFFFDFPKHDFTFTILPNGLKKPTLVETKRILPLSVYIPDGFQLVGEQVYEYEIYDPMAYNHKIPLKFTLTGKDFRESRLFYWDLSQNSWIEFPNQSLEDGVLTGFAYATKLRLAVFRAPVSEGKASWYKYKNCDCAASPFYARGTKLLVQNLDNGKEVVITVNDFGPERDKHPDRVIDLDAVAFDKIAKRGAGVINVRVTPFVETVPESTEPISDSPNILPEQ